MRKNKSHSYQMEIVEEFLQQKQKQKNLTLDNFLVVKKISNKFIEDIKILYNEIQYKKQITNDTDRICIYEVQKILGLKPKQINKIVKKGFLKRINNLFFYDEVISLYNNEKFKDIIKEIFKEIEEEKEKKVKKISLENMKLLNSVELKLRLDKTLTNEDFNYLMEKVKDYIVKNKNKLIQNKIIYNYLNFIKESLNYDKSKSELIKSLDLANYPKSFHNTRKIKRNINFVVGPTNSGKTYEALETLSISKSGIYLAPLRLMAFEVFDKLNKIGVPCNLITGEEKIMIEGANHTSSTIECADINNEIETAIIDEFQMIGDKDRGWAWTRAIFGIPAKNVFIVGNDMALYHCCRLLEKYTHDNITIKKKKRISTLKLAQPISLKDLKNGDALIAFSRKEVISYAAELQEMGKKVSLIYGSLSPEIRRKQSELFASGKNEILVATDAIGMGLNLPIDRVVFSKIIKYDGVVKRLINSTEAKQISGRAGRYKKNGEVTVLDTHYNILYNSINTIKELLNEPNKEILKFPISPNEWHVNKIIEVLKYEKLSKVLRVFPKLCHSNNFYSTITEDMINLCHILDRELETYSVSERLKFSFTPVSTDSDFQMDYFQQIIDIVFKKNKKLLYNFNKQYKNRNYKDLKQAEEELKLMIIYKFLSKYDEEKIEYDSTLKRKEYLEKYILEQITNIKNLNIY